MTHLAAFLLILVFVTLISLIAWTANKNNEIKILKSGIRDLGNRLGYEVSFGQFHAHVSLENRERSPISAGEYHHQNNLNARATKALEEYLGVRLTREVTPSMDVLKFVKIKK